MSGAASSQKALTSATVPPSILSTTPANQAYALQPNAAMSENAVRADHSWDSAPEPSEPKAARKSYVRGLSSQPLRKSSTEMSSSASSGCWSRGSAVSTRRLASMMR